MNVCFLGGGVGFKVDPYLNVAFGQNDLRGKHRCYGELSELQNQKFMTEASNKPQEKEGDELLPTQALVHDEFSRRD